MEASVAYVEASCKLSPSPLALLRPDPTRTRFHLVPCSHPQGSEMQLSFHRSPRRPSSHPNPHPETQCSSAATTKTQKEDMRTLVTSGSRSQRNYVQLLEMILHLRPLPWIALARPRKYLALPWKYKKASMEVLKAYMESVKPSVEIAKISPRVRSTQAASFTLVYFHGSRRKLPWKFPLLPWK